MNEDKESHRNEICDEKLTLRLFQGQTAKSARKNHLVIL